jgi:hypothetical protein
MLQDIDWAGLSRIDEIGVPMALGTTLDVGGDANANRRLLTVPPGQCFVITSITGDIAQADADSVEVSPALASRIAVGVHIEDASNTEASAIRTMPFVRWRDLFNNAASASWRTAPANNNWVWKPKMPICVPAGYHVGHTQPLIIGNGASVRGYLIADRAAALMGLDTNTVRTTRRQGVASAMATNSATALIPARTGKSVQILDIFVRVQPLAAAAANVLTIRQTDAKDIFRFVNDNPANLMQQQLSPGICTAPGTGVSILSTTTNTASVSIVYRYLDAADVPANHWWSCIDPEKPSSTSTLPGASAAPLATFYPATGRTVASGLAGPANQNIMKGYVITANQNARSEVGVIRLGTGATPGLPGFGAFVANVGTPVTQTLTLYQPEQTLWAGESDITVKSRTNHAFWWESIAPLAAATPTPVRNWGCTAWGFTVPAIDAVGTRIRGTAT